MKLKEYGDEVIGRVDIANKDTTCNISVSQKESSAVVRAAKDLCNDLSQICGCHSKIQDEGNKIMNNIYVGTIGVSSLIDRKIADGTLKVDAIKKTATAYHWEGFILQEDSGSLYIVGVNRRGTIFGIYEFCRMSGVSPWYFFADVPIKRKDKVAVKGGFYLSDYPSVPYRGIFINDEEELDAWAKKHTVDDTIGPEAYERIFELLLRLKANYIWPAMHVNYFNENPLNGKLAEEMGIVVGTSHCDMLLRSNQNEWQPWVEKKGYTDISYDYSIAGSNRDKLKEYWRESVEQNRDYEVCYSVGMRGIHDSSSLTETIDANTELDDAGRTRAKVELLEKVIVDQRGLIKEVLGEEQGREALQTFIPYKEAMLLYDQGLKVPEDITLIWVDDNYGYMRRYPDVEERQRSGGHGLYYHSSYWAPGSMSYLFINSIPLAHTGNELRKAYESGIQKIWVLNIGAIKPLEQDMEFFLQFAWEVGSEDALTSDSFTFIQQWIDDNFSGNHGEEVAELLIRYSQITNVRKVEHMDTDLFSQTAYGNEAGRRVKQLEAIFHQANQIYFNLKEEEKDAFFQLVLMKIHTSYYVNCEYYYADRSNLSYTRGNMKAADEYIELSRDMLDYKRWMIHYYNKIMANGKWDKILTPESFTPPVTAMYPDGKPALRIGEPELSVNLWNQEISGDEGALYFSKYGKKVKYIELGNKGGGKVPYIIEVVQGGEWLSVTDPVGSVSAEKIILVEFKDNLYKGCGLGKIQIWNPSEENKYTINVHVEKDIAIEVDYKGYIEADGFISIPATGFSEKASVGETSEIGWVKVPYMGRYEGDAMMARNPELCPLTEDVAMNPYLQYDFYSTNDEELVVEIFRFLTLDSVGRIRLGLSIDDGIPIIIESEIRDEWLGDWKGCVMDNGEKLRTRLPLVKKGQHNLRVYMIDNYVTISKIVLYGNKYKVSNLGPPWSYFMGTKPNDNESEHVIHNRRQMARLLKELYIEDQSLVPLPNVIYQGRDFWEKDLCFAKSEAHAQTQLGDDRYQRTMAKEGRKDIIKMFGEGVFNEENGIISIEAEYALENSKCAYLTGSKDEEIVVWTHTQSETNGRTGLAMHVKEKKLIWKDPAVAPGMHYRINVHKKGTYHVWLLMRIADYESESCYIALDGEVQPLEKQLSGGKLFYYSTHRVFFWGLLSDLVIEVGEHIFSIIAGMSRLRVDRIYLTQGEERPWMDVDWQDSKRI